MLGYFIYFLAGMNKLLLRLVMESVKCVMLSLLLCIVVTNKVKNFGIFSQYEYVNVIIFEYLFFSFCLSLH